MSHAHFGFYLLVILLSGGFTIAFALLHWRIGYFHYGPDPDLTRGPHNRPYWHYTPGYWNGFRFPWLELVLAVVYTALLRGGILPFELDTILLLFVFWITVPFSWLMLCLFHAMAQR